MSVSIGQDKTISCGAMFVNKASYVWDTYYALNKSDSFIQVAVKVALFITSITLVPFIILMVFSENKEIKPVSDEFHDISQACKIQRVANKPSMKPSQPVVERAETRLYGELKPEIREALKAEILAINRANPRAKPFRVMVSEASDAGEDTDPVLALIRPQVHRIANNIWVGSDVHIKTVLGLERGTGHEFPDDFLARPPGLVVSLCKIEHFRNAENTGGITKHLYYPYDDKPSECEKFIAASETIFSEWDQALNAGLGVLIHCAAGQSRSASMLIHYLVRTLGITFQEAHNAVMALRPQIDDINDDCENLARYNLMGATRIYCDTAYAGRVE